jgi:hypothetical protein
MSFDLTEDDYTEMNDSFDKLLDALERYEDLNPEEIADLRRDEQNRRDYEDMMLASWSY